MVRIIVFAAVGLIVGLAGGTGFTVMRAPMPKPAAAPHVVESSPVAPSSASSHAVGAHATPAPPAPSSAAPPPPAESPSAASAVTADAASAPGPIALPLPRPIPVPAGLGAAGPHSGPPDYKRVSSILVNMKVDEAGRILGLLNDEQVEGILRTLGARQAAAVMAGMSAERAAALSRRLLRPEPEAK